MEKEKDWGILTQIEVGEYGRGRRMTCLPCRNDIEIKKGMNADITIGLTKNGRPRINKGIDSKYDHYKLLYLQWMNTHIWIVGNNRALA